MHGVTTLKGFYRQQGDTYHDMSNDTLGVPVHCGTFDIAMEHGPFIDDLPIRHGDISIWGFP